MKLNLPVTGVERRFDGVIISKTDQRGRITCCNALFLEVSGFTREAVIGQSHNILRHPDMPVAVFAGLWRTITAGKTWQGIIQNRCANGDHYWVEALVTCIEKDGAIEGYKSVRRPITRAEMVEAQDRYHLILKAEGRTPHCPGFRDARQD